ncbi:MAG: Uma2 family endonuclease, partial [Cyanobacteria bacterium]|nr:Uma2 family endonuclease [Cyanobacteria bacterium GSL.Bin21]
METLTFALPQNTTLHVSRADFAAIAAVNRDLQL